MPVIKTIVLYISVCFFQTTNCIAQPVLDTNKHQPNIDSVLNKTDAAFSAHATSDSTIKVLETLYKDDTLVKHALRDYHLYGLKHRQESLQWNLNSGIIIFWCVIVLVFSGIAFAGIQFYKSMHQPKGIAIDPNLILNTEFEVNLKGFKINSPVLGVIILLISLMFFYLYLVYVYPITEIF
ncbi:MAG: hypothetical protein LH478_12980 [Chitinophagaceae bacterium]|nr:hypothetical protein [Chitinophagaceae bacterium]